MEKSSHSMKKEKFDTQYFIGFSCNEEERYYASSGGIGTAITKHLLSTDTFKTGVTFIFDSEQCMYIPQIIHSSSEVNICGSIYQDIDVYNFIKEHLNDIRGGLVVSCPPCQVVSLRLLLKKNNIDNFIISFTCSGQTTIEGTWKYYELLNIKKKDVKNIQYRGNGWPNGIQITLRDGMCISRPNYSEPWSSLHKSWIYRPKRCLFCKFDTGHNADVSIADPWLKKYIESDKIGHSFVLIHSLNGKKVIDQLINLKDVSVWPSSRDDYINAQKYNVEKAFFVSENSEALRLYCRILQNKVYARLMSNSLTMLHYSILLKRIFFSIYRRYFRFKKMLRVFFPNDWLFKMKRKLRYFYYKRKFGSYNGSFGIGNNVVINNPQCIHLGNLVGIGDNSFLGPVVRYAGKTYTPIIKIGDNTGIGKNCSLAAINRVEIGKNVLFAGHVHITDHSHGYENIELPIAKQQLISKGAVVIEDNCWLGFNCEILSGVHIGKNSVVGARAVVTHDVPPYSIVAGNPAKLIKQFNFETQKWERVKSI